MLLLAAAGVRDWRRLTHTSLAARRALEASVAGALEGTNDIDTLAMGTQAVTQGTLVDVCGVGGSTRLVGVPGEGGRCPLCPLGDETHQTNQLTLPTSARPPQAHERTRPWCTQPHTDTHKHKGTDSQTDLTLTHTHHAHTCTPTRTLALM